MEKDRNCGASYPVYPTSYSGAMMPGPMPISGVNMPMPMPIGAPTPYTNVTTFDSVSYGNDTNSLASQINSLEQRISNLENMLNGSSYSSTSYNTTNYQMM